MMLVVHKRNLSKGKVNPFFSKKNKKKHEFVFEKALHCSAGAAALSPASDPLSHCDKVQYTQCIHI